jgi:hypothetical protein
VVKNAMGVDEVKRRIVEWQAFSVPLDKRSLQTRQLETLASYRYCGVSKVERSVMRASAGKPFGLTAASAADFQYSQSLSSFKTHCRFQAAMDSISVIVEAAIERWRPARLGGEPRVTG